MPDQDPLQTIMSILGVKTAEEAVYEVWALRGRVRVLEEKIRPYSVERRVA